MPATLRALLAAVLLFTVGCAGSSDAQPAAVTTEGAEEVPDDATRCSQMGDRSDSVAGAVQAVVDSNRNTHDAAKTLAVSSLSNYLAAADGSVNSHLVKVQRDGAEQLRQLKSLTANTDYQRVLSWAGDTLDMVIDAQSSCLQILGR